MMTRKYRRLSRHLKNKKWILNRLNKLEEELRDLASYEIFECSSFFRGYELAERNYTKYENKKRKVLRHIRFLDQVLTKLNND